MNQNNDNRTPEEIQAEIQQTRKEMSQTVDELQEKLAPENLKAQAKEKVQETVQGAKERAREKLISAKDSVVGRTKETVHDTGERVGAVSAKATAWIQNNPLSATAIGIGLGAGLFLLARSRGSSSRNAQVRDFRDNYYPARPYYERHHDYRTYNRDRYGARNRKHLRGESQLLGLTACIEACFDCAQSCTSCADACLGEDNVAEMRRCIRTCLDCADVCVTTGQLLSRTTEADWSLLRAQVHACLTACNVCAAECEAHAEHMEHCRVCAEACRSCERACTNLLNTMPA